LAVKSKQNKLLANNGISWLVKHGTRPEGVLVSEYVRNITGDRSSYLTACPPIEAGTTASSGQWKTALENLNTDLEAIRRQLTVLESGSLENDWQYIKRQLAYVEGLNSIKTDSATGSFVERFTHLSYLFDKEAEELPEQNCEIDFQRMCVTLQQQDGWCSKQDISDSDMLWRVEPAKSPTKQSGSITSIIAGNDEAWVLSAGDTTSATLVITVRPRRAVTGNTVFVDIISRYDDISVLVNGNKATAVNEDKTWWVFSTQPVSSIELVITKSNYDTDTGKKHYFCIRNITLLYNKYTNNGTYVSHAVEIEGSEVRVKPEISLPEGTSVTYHIGFQEDRRIHWQIVSAGKWVRIPWLGDKTTEYISYNPTDTPVQTENGIYVLYQFSEQPDVSSIELYPGLNMWAVENVTVDNGEPTLENWFKLRQGATIYRYIPMSTGLTVHSGQMYRLYTYALIDMPDGAVIENWRPAPASAACNVYVNSIEQAKENNKYNLKLYNGWNLIEIIVTPDKEFFFDPMLYLEDSASITCLSQKPAQIVSLENMKHTGSSPVLNIAAYHNGMLLVNYPAKSTGFMRYLCRYYIQGSTGALVRFMASMDTDTPDFSPILTGYTIQWR